MDGARTQPGTVRGCGNRLGRDRRLAWEVDQQDLQVTAPGGGEGSA